MDSVAFRVTKAGRPVALEPKAFEVLVFLLENPGRLVEKRELLEKVWPDTVVTESAMTRVIADLRRALGDAAREARYIETVPTKGYRFIAEVRRPDGAPPCGPPAASPVSVNRAPRRGGARLFGGIAVAGLLALVLVAVRAPRKRAAEPASLPAPARLSQLTDSLGLDDYPSFSPDGAQLAYCSDRDGAFEIYVRQLAAGGREIRVTSDGRNNVQPAWSPDGTRIAYASRVAPGIWVVPALGGEPRRLTTFGARPAWSPDGETIAFESPSFTNLGAPSRTTLWTVPAGGGEPEPLTRVAMPPGAHGSPAFTPDGSAVLFVSASAASEIWSVTRKDGSLHRILPREEDIVPGVRPVDYSDPAFSPRDGALYYTASSHYQTGSLWRSRVPASTGAPWGAPERVTPDATAAVRHLAISRTGRIAYAALSIRSNLWSLPLDPKTSLPSGEPVPLTRSAGCRAQTPRFSPDGRRIAYVSCRVGLTTDVWIVDAAGGEPQPALTLGPNAGVPDWLDGGEKIAFLSAKGGTRSLWSMDLRDGTQKLLRPLDFQTWPLRLSPNGKLVAYTRDSPGQGLHTLVAPLDGGPGRSVTPPDVSASYPCWSPDGATLAIHLPNALDWYIATVSATGGKPTVLVREKGWSWASGWSPDGGRICFAGLRDGIWNVYWVARTGGPARRLTANTKERTFLREPAWSPRGDQIVYELSETTGNIWLLEPPK